MAFKSILVPVGNKENKKTGEAYFYCPKIMKIFGTLKEKNIPPHLLDRLECTCERVLSAEKGSELILEFERSQNLRSICAIGIYFQNQEYYEKTKRITDIYTSNYNNGKKKEIPTNFNAPELKHILNPLNK